MNHGFIQLPLFGWLAIGATVLVAGMGIALKVQTSRLETCKDEYARFVAQVKAEGEAAAKRAAEQEAKDKQAKEKADAESALNRKRIDDLTRRLRNERAARSYVPSPAPGSPSPQRPCFDRETLERAIQQFAERVAGLIEQGDKAIVDLNTAKGWAQ